MRKIIAISTLIAASLAVSACNKSEAPADANVAAPEVNAADAMEGTTNDAMTNSEAAAGAETNMTADANATDAAANAVDANAADAMGAAENAAK